ncbi:MAG: hypothetical protein FWD57_11915 [Polyangiaceae bacterium]|nr:hypothetical protein [Polyangiaceae bacterium]
MANHHSPDNDNPANPANPGTTSLPCDEENRVDFHIDTPPKTRYRDSMPIKIEQTPLGGNLKHFLNVVDTIYHDDPNYVRPLDLDIKERLSHKNPFFEHSEGTIFTAFINNKCVGRCTAQIDREHLRRYDDGCGSFGFFDTINNAEVAKALLDRAADWLRCRDMKIIRGPLSLCTNEELGCLVQGFDTPPYFMMPHHRDYQGQLIEAAGLAKVKDLFAWHYKINDIPARAARAHATIAAMPEVKVRSVDYKHAERDIRIIMDVYNDAWSSNWGFVPLTENELAKMAADMKLILIPELSEIIEINGEPVAVAMSIPNINEMIGDINGKLFPTGAAKLLWRLKVKGPKSARLIILGIRKKLRGMRKFAGLSTFMYVEMHHRAKRIGLTDGELSWTIEDNAPINIGISFMGGKKYRIMRLYEKSI